MKTPNLTRKTPWTTLMPLAALAALASACGGAPETQLQRNAQNELPNPTVTNLPAPAPTPAPTQTPNLSTDPTFRSDYPTQQFELTGNGGNKPIWPAEDGAYPDGFPVYTDTKLRIRISARAAGNVSLPSDSQWKYSNYQASYRCVSYVIMVNGAVVGTRVLATDGVGSILCPYARTNEVIDVSRFLTPGQEGPIHVQVTGPRTDWYCGWLASSTSNWTNYLWWMSNYGWNWQYYFNQMYAESCTASLRDSHRSHTVRGAIEFEVNSPDVN
jgi:hypothetical protein